MSWPLFPQEFHSLYRGAGIASNGNDCWAGVFTPNSVDGHEKGRRKRVRAVRPRSRRLSDGEKWVAGLASACHPPVPLTFWHALDPRNATLSGLSSSVTASACQAWHALAAENRWASVPPGATESRYDDLALQPARCIKMIHWRLGQKDVAKWPSHSGTDANHYGRACYHEK